MLRDDRMKKFRVEYHFADGADSRELVLQALDILLKAVDLSAFVNPPPAEESAVSRTISNCGKARTLRRTAGWAVHGRERSQTFKERPRPGLTPEKGSNVVH